MDAPQNFTQLRHTHTLTQIHEGKAMENVAKLKVTSSHKRYVLSFFLSILAIFGCCAAWGRKTKSILILSPKDLASFPKLSESKER